jgi:phytoene dehydrogenase-like protein
MKKIIIIGAGISGLSAGCYAAMNGYEVNLLEANPTPGGLCTTWIRKGYHIDGSCHSLVGSGSASPDHKIWRELGAIQGRRIVDYEYFAGMTARDGRVFRLYTDLDRLERHMKELSPADAAPIGEFCGYARRFAHFNLPVEKPVELMGFLEGLRMMLGFLPFIKLFGELGSLTLESFAARFQDPLLRDGIKNANYGAPGSLFTVVMPLGWMSRKDGGYPIGGSLALARAVEARFTGLGGTIRYGARVAKVLERNGRTTGVRLEDGTELEADYVISACDMKGTLTKLLDGSRIDPAHKELLDTGTVIGPVTQVAVGADLDLSGSPASQLEAFQLPNPISIGGRTVEWFNFKHYAFDPDMAPRGKSVLLSMFLCDWPFWEKLKGDPAAYRAEKERTAEACIGALETRFPGIRTKVEMVDVATPLTYERYTGNWKGTHMSWQTGEEFQRKHPFIPKTVPGLDGFYLASMWTNAPGGLSGAAEVGRGVVQLLCARDRKKFTTNMPAGL